MQVKTRNRLLWRLLLKVLLKLENSLSKMIANLAIRYEGGVHPKHRLTRYHDFFIKNVKRGEWVLDVGSGIGLLSYDVAQKGVEVLGIDTDKEAVRFAHRRYKLSNLYFIVGRAPDFMSSRPFDVVMLSNVLEHIDDRVAFLRSLMERARAKRFLIRVPLFDRSWLVPLKRELNVEWRLDPDHKVEYTSKKFVKEVKDAGLIVESMNIKWGELYAVCTPKTKSR